MLGTGTSPSPSAFEAVFVDRMAASFEPAFMFAARTAAQHVRAIAPVARYGDELYALLRLAVERYFIQRQGASFAESFYGFARRPASGAARMNSRDRIGSLLMLVGAPYAWRKLGAYCERARADLEMERALRSSVGGRVAVAPSESGVALLRRLTLALFPLLHTGGEALVLLFQLGFALKLTPYHTPAMRALGLKLARMSGTSALGAPPSVAGAAAATDGALGRIGRFKAALGSGLKWSLVGGMVAFRMLQFVESRRERGAGVRRSAEGAAAAGAIDALVPPSPPVPVPVPPGYAPGSCMLTKLPLTNPAVTPAGYVFNYQPLLVYVQRHGACPVSGQPCGIDDVRSLRL
jgi:peroxin-12